MANEPSDSLEVKVAVAVKVVEHLVAICRGFESDEWMEKFLLVRDALVSGRYKDAVREEAKLTRYSSPAKWVGSRYVERRLQEVMGVLNRQLSYPNHSEPAVEIGELPSDVTVDLEAEIRARLIETEARRIELATVGYLSVTGGAFEGRLVALRTGQTLIGSHHSCQICLSDPAVDRIQASIIETGGGFLIASLSDGKPTFLNETRVHSEGIELKDSDVIQFNDNTIQFFRRVPNPREAQVTPTSLRPQKMRNTWKLAAKTSDSKSPLDWLLEDISRRGLEIVMAEELMPGHSYPTREPHRYSEPDSIAHPADPRPGQPLHRWKIDAVELGHLKEICANPDDTSTWHAYADWLDERDEVRAEFLRALTMLGSLSKTDDRFEPFRRRCIELYTQVDSEWATAMLGLRQSRILNCGDAPPSEPQLRFAFQCPNQWDSLVPGVDPNARFCKNCSKNVYFCNTTEEAEVHGMAGNCIAISSRVALEVKATADEAQELLRPAGMTLGVLSFDKRNPLEGPPDDKPYRTWGDILFTNEK